MGVVTICGGLYDTIFLPADGRWPTDAVAHRMMKRDSFVCSGARTGLSGVRPMPVMPPFSTVRSPIGNGRRNDSHTDRRAAPQSNVDQGHKQKWTASRPFRKLRNLLGELVMADRLPPHLQLIQMGRAHVVSRTVYAAAKLGLADQLATEPKSAAELAGPMRVHAPSLHRLMRTLASLGILTEQTGQRFALTNLGEALKTGAPGSARSSLLFSGSPWSQSGWDNVIYSIETGNTGFEKAQGVSLFDYLAEHPEDASLFSEMMVGLHSQEPPAVAAAYDFSIFKTVVDVGGASGNMLSAVLVHHSGPRGILFDRPHVVHDAPSLLAGKGVSERVTIEPGDFFTSVPTDADAYILSHIIHDWNEDQCLTILGHVRKAMNPAGRLLIVEMVLPPGDTPHPGKMLDMAMLVQTGGQERTAAEYRILLSKAGFHLAQVVPTNSAASIMEAVVA
jgi:hypothetical protein